MGKMIESVQAVFIGRGELNLGEDESFRVSRNYPGSTGKSALGKINRSTDQGTEV